MDTSEAVKGILKYREVIHKESQWNDPLSLSDTMVRLSVYNAYLADNIAGLHHDATQAYNSSYKVARDMEATVADSENLAKAESLERRTEHENIKYIHKATSDLISVLQSRLRVIENAKREEGLQ